MNVRFVFIFNFHAEVFVNCYGRDTGDTKKFEDEEVGIWNKVRQIFFENNTKYIQVPAWTNWILKMIKEKVNVEK